MTRTTATIIGGIGKFLIGVGLVVILFAGFQLWGTGILEARAQGALDDDFDDRIGELRDAGLVAEVDDTGEVTDDEDPAADDRGIADPVVAAAVETTFGPRDTDDDIVVTPIEPSRLSPEQIALLTPDEGEVLGRIEIPDIGLERNIVEGIRRDDLRQGPGHYPSTPLPGQPGNAAIAGHRTTYGQPFHDLDLLQPGDLIRVTTFQGEHYYQVDAQVDEEGNEVGHFIVTPEQVEVLEDKGDNRLTLTACHPKRSSRLRIVVTATLVSAPRAVLPDLPDPEPGLDDTLPDEPAGDGLADEPTDDTDEVASDEIADDALEESLGWNWEERPPTLAWGGLAAAVVVAALLLARRFNRWAVYALALPIFAVPLFFCFVHLDRMLPAL